MNSRFLLVALAALLATVASARAATRVSLSGTRWLIDGKPVNPGAAAEGLLMNVRIVNATFEDRDRTDFDAEANTDRFIAKIPDYAAQGVNAFTLKDHNQTFPFRFDGAADDPVFYAALKAMTSGRPVTPPKSATTTAPLYFPPPESQGGWRSVENEDEIEASAGMDKGKIAELREWLLKSDDRPFAAVVIRRGTIVLQVERGNSATSDTRNIKSCAKAICATVLAIASEESRHDRTPRKMSFDDKAFCENVTGQPYDQFATGHLLEPLGVEKWWFEFFEGDRVHGRHPSHAIGLPAREMARIGYCMLRGGLWDGKQVIPEWFVRETAAPTHTVTGIKTFGRDAPSFSHGWELPGLLSGGRGDGIPKDARFKPGSGGQLISFVPSLDLVIARQTGGSGQWDYEEFLRRACESVLH